MQMHLEQHVAVGVVIAGREHLEREVPVVIIRHVQREVIGVGGVDGAGDADFLGLGLEELDEAGVQGVTLFACMIYRSATGVELKYLRADSSSCLRGCLRSSQQESSADL